MAVFIKLLPENTSISYKGEGFDRFYQLVRLALVLIVFYFMYHLIEDTVLSAVTSFTLISLILFTPGILEVLSRFRRNGKDWYTLDDTIGEIQFLDEALTIKEGGDESFISYASIRKIELVYNLYQGKRFPLRGQAIANGLCRIQISGINGRVNHLVLLVQSIEQYQSMLKAMVTWYRTGIEVVEIFGEKGTRTCMTNVSSFNRKQEVIQMLQSASLEEIDNWGRKNVHYWHKEHWYE